MASGKLTTTTPIDTSQPANSAGTDVTMMTGSKNRCRNLLEFHAFTQSCWLSQLDSCSAGEVPVTLMTWSVAGMSWRCPSAVV